MNSTSDTTILEGGYENIFNGEPSKEISHPLFSIVIPCYNGSNVMRDLMMSLTQQDCTDLMEVIIVDDHSTNLDYVDFIVGEFFDKLCIRMFRTDFNNGPGDARQLGLQHATGDWICFADHDDMFTNHAFDKVKKVIDKYKEPFYIITTFVEYDVAKQKVVNTFKGNRNWNHGKFINRVNLMNKYGIRFKKNLRTHEDIAITSQINCAMHNEGRRPLLADVTTYMWNSRPTTLTRRYAAKGEHTFIEKFLKDYITSTGEVYIEKYESGMIDKDYALNNCLQVVLYLYFYANAFIFNNPKGYYRDNIDYIREYNTKVKELFNMTNHDIYEYCADNGAAFYNRVQRGANIGTAGYIPSYTLKEWLDYIHKDINYAEHRIPLMEDLD